MPEMQLAVLSDIHGNRWALEAVLQDIDRRGIQDVVNLGDSLYGPLDPAGTARMLLPRSFPTVRGNEDRIIVDPPPARVDSPTLRFVRERLGPQDLQWLDALSLTTVVRERFRLFHGSLERDDEYLLQVVSSMGVTPRPLMSVAAMLTTVREPVVLCGHDHTPRCLHPSGDKLVVNPGSVGLPAYTDDLPRPHAMATGTPHARYAIVSWNSGGWSVQELAVDYDWESAAAAATRNGRPDWAHWLRTGRTDDA
jgi:putative phosphoesterase